MITNCPGPLQSGCPGLPPCLRGQLLEEMGKGSPRFCSNWSTAGKRGLGCLIPNCEWGSQLGDEVGNWDVQHLCCHADGLHQSGPNHFVPISDPKSWDLILQPVLLTLNWRSASLFVLLTPTSSNILLLKSFYTQRLNSGKCTLLEK